MVYRGRNVKLGTAIAVKILHAHRATDAVVVERFIDEARFLSRLAHPNCPKVYDFGQDQHGRFYIVMELVAEGRSLEAMLAQEAPLPLDRIVALGVQILSVLQASHAQGVIHADLKPANVFVLEPAGQAAVVKVLDFGVAQVSHAAADRVLGTPEYMSPEQARGESLDPRSDLYAFGVVLYEMASGLLPFTGATPLAVVAAVIDEPVPLLSTRLRGGVHLGLEGLIMSCLAKNRVERPASAEIVAAQLLALEAEALSPAAAMPVVDDEDASMVVAQLRKSKRKGALVAMGVGLVLLVAVVAVVWRSWSRPERAAPTSPGAPGAVALDDEVALPFAAMARAGEQMREGAWVGYVRGALVPSPRLAVAEAPAREVRREPKGGSGATGTPSQRRDKAPVAEAPSRGDEAAAARLVAHGEASFASGNLLKAQALAEEALVQAPGYRPALQLQRRIARALPSDDE